MQKRGKQVKLDPQTLKKEIEMQTKALNRIGSWIKIALLVSTVGVLVTYFGYTYQRDNLFFTIGGIVLIVLGLVAAIFFGYGHRNGYRNVQRMIDELEKEKKSKK